MLRPNYSTFEHAIALIRILTQALVGRDLRFAFNKCVFFLQNNFFANLFKNASL